METLHIGSGPFYEPHHKAYNIKPGWNEHMAELHAKARCSFKAWAGSGKDRRGLLFEEKKRAIANFKYVPRFIRKNENMINSDSLSW